MDRALHARPRARREKGEELTAGDAFPGTLPDVTNPGRVLFFSGPSADGSVPRARRADPKPHTGHTRRRRDLPRATGNAAPDRFMNMNFTPVSLEGADLFYARWEATPQRSIDYSLVNLWGWQQHYGLEWSFEGDLCWVRQTCPCDTVFWAPVGDWTRVDWERVLEPGMEFVRVPEKLKEIWEERVPGRVTFTEARGQWEYLYSRDDLARLPGNRFHKKKNHVSSFIRAYGEPDYRPLDDRMVEDCLALQDTWCQWHDCEGSPSLTAENDAINRVLSHYDRFRGLCGGSVYIRGDIVAFSLGERLDADTMGVHYEKGLNDIRGVYQLINNVFCVHECGDVEWVNRAQDLDEEGLRHAKESYHPAGFLHKFSARIS